MTSVPPYGIRRADAARRPRCGGAGAARWPRSAFAATVASGELGVASAIKMCRSVMIKGLEAIVIESFLTARRYGVETGSARVAGRDVPRPRLGEAGQLLLAARRPARQAPRRGDARGGGDGARSRARAVRWRAAIAERQAWVAALAAGGAFAARRRMPTGATSRTASRGTIRTAADASPLKSAGKLSSRVLQRTASGQRESGREAKQRVRRVPEHPTAFPGVGQDLLDVFQQHAVVDVRRRAQVRPVGRPQAGVGRVRVEQRVDVRLSVGKRKRLRENFIDAGELDEGAPGRGEFEQRAKAGLVESRGRPSAGRSGRSGCRTPERTSIGSSGIEQVVLDLQADEHVERAQALEQPRGIRVVVDAVVRDVPGDADDARGLERFEFGRAGIVGDDGDALAATGAARDRVEQAAVVECRSRNSGRRSARGACRRRPSSTAAAPRVPVSCPGGR